jgi:lipid II:glycine glycyltransferase (peptidoglycan interpeptide bridge formation enzyme)
MIKEITSNEEWEEHLKRCSGKSLLSSWSWGEFQMSEGHEIKRLGVVDNETLKAVALAVKIKARRGTYILIQHGPNVADDFLNEKQEILKELFFGLAEWGKKEGAAFIRCAPLLERTPENRALFKNLSFPKFKFLVFTSKFLDSPMHANAYEATWKLDITPSEDRLLQEMRKTTRYLIRQAQKNTEIKIEKSDRIEDLAFYRKLNRDVAQRQKFAAFSDDYIKNEFEIFRKDGQALLFFGKHKNSIAAGALVIFWQGTAYYHQAASLAEYAKLSIPYLLQWEAIKVARSRGCRWYDFWGYVDPKAQPNHPWAGPTLFKMGFGGKALEYIKTQDLPLSWKYWSIHMFEKIRRIKRGL